MTNYRVILRGIRQGVDRFEFCRKFGEAYGITPEKAEETIKRKQGALYTCPDPASAEKARAFLESLGGNVEIVNLSAPLPQTSQDPPSGGYPATHTPDPAPQPFPPPPGITSQGPPAQSFGNVSANDGRAQNFVPPTTQGAAILGSACNPASQELEKKYKAARAVALSFIAVTVLITVHTVYKEVSNPYNRYTGALSIGGFMVMMLGIFMCPAIIIYTEMMFKAERIARYALKSARARSGAGITAETVYPHAAMAIMKRTIFANAWAFIIVLDGLMLYAATYSILFPLLLSSLAIICMAMIIRRQSIMKDYQVAVRRAMRQSDRMKKKEKI